MAGRSPLSMMQRPARQPAGSEPRPARTRGRRRWPVLAPVAILAVLALAWCVLWYFAANIADRTMAGWIEREAAAGRVYTCGEQYIGGFPLGMVAHCVGAAATIKTSEPPYDVKAKSVTFAAEVYAPTRLTGDIVGPVTLADAGQAPIFSADWTHARVTVRGVPPDPEAFSVELHGPHLDQIGGGTLFKATRTDLHGRVIGGALRNYPVIEATLHLAGATAPSLHPLLANPIDLELDAVLRGFKDLLPKPWPARFREMQAAGGGVDIKSLRFTHGDAIVVGSGNLRVNEHGKLDGVVRVAIAGLEAIVPLIGFDQMLARGLDQLSGTPGAGAQGMNALDQLLPGLGSALRQTANASLIETLKQMGEPGAIGNQPAIVLPLRFADGAIYLGMLRVGEAPPLF